jgi:hypothetical protein
MKTNIMKRTAAGLTAVLTVASYAPSMAVFAATELEYHEAVPATCTETGTIAYYTDGEGNKYADAEGTEQLFDSDIVVPVQHQWPEKPQWAWFKTAEGVYEGASAFFKCEECGEKATISATVTSEEVPATCTTDGKITYTAEVVFEGNTYTDTKEVTIEALGHDWGETTLEWTKSELGEDICKAKRVCKNDDTHVEEEVVRTTYEVTKEPTVNEEGTGVYTAVFENPAFGTQTKEVTLSKVGAEYGNFDYKWSEDNSMVIATADCLNGTADDAIREEAVTTVEHTKPATCTEDGIDTYTATFKNENFETQTLTVAVPATGHTYGAPEFVWNEDNTCNAHFTCEDCNDVLTREAEVTTKVTKKATCDKDGEAELTATVTLDGKTYESETKTVTVPATGHQWDVTWFWKDEETAVAYFRCTVDGAEEAHIATVKTETKDATCDKEGLITRTATVVVDGKTYTDVQEVGIAKLPHEFEAAEYTHAATEDGYTFTARRECENCTEYEEETVTANYTVVTEPTVSTKGVGLYTATFTNPAFETQTLEVEIAKVLPNYGEPTYKWSDDYSAVIAKRECLNGTADDALIETVTTTSEVTKPATCTTKGQTTYYAEFDNDAFTTQEYTVENIEMVPHTYDTPVFDWYPTETGYTATMSTTCTVCGAEEIYDATVTVTSKDGKLLYTATCTVDGVTYKATLKVNAQDLKNPVVSYQKGDNAVKLNWTAVPGAEKYAVLGFVNDKWRILGTGYGTSYTLEGLTAGEEYRVAVVAMFNGKWNLDDLSNVITVTPNAPVTPKYPVVTVQTAKNAFKLSWDAVEGADKYAIAYYSAGKWKILAQVDGGTTSYLNTKVPSGTYQMVVGARIGGKWDASNINQRAVTVTVK